MAVADIKPDKASVFTLIPFGDIALSTATNYAIRGLIPQEGLIVVYGPPKCGKSFWVMDMTLHVALNWLYRGRKVKNGPVVYIACEGISGVNARVEAFRQNKLNDDCGHIPFYLIAATVDLINNHKSLVASIQAGIIEKTSPRIVVIDTLNRSLSGDENNSKDMGDYIKAADHIRETLHCAVIIIHHSGYDATHARGHTSLAAAIDTQISVKRDKERDNAVIATLDLMKDGEQGGEIVSRLESVEVGVDDEGDPITSCIVIAEENIDTKPAKSELTFQEQSALDLITELLSECGFYHDGNKRIKAMTRVIKENTWEDECENARISDAKDLESRSRVFRRTKMILKKKKLIDFWGEFVWIK